MGSPSGPRQMSAEACTTTEQITTPKAKRTPVSAPRLQPGARESSRRAVEYSEAPLTTINVASLSSSRFLLPATRKLPYRDKLGRININLVRMSLADIDEYGTGKEERAKLLSWERHARHALAARPEDERLSLKELMAADACSFCTNMMVESSGLDERESPLNTSAVCSGQASRVLMRRRLFRVPRPGDKPEDFTPDLAYLHKIEKQRYMRHRSETSGSDASSDYGTDDDVYQVEAILDENERGFLIKWKDYGPEHNSWEPEENVAPELVHSFRQECARVRLHEENDFMSGRARMLWCSACKCHLPSDSFSTRMRSAEPAGRACLNHHYNGRTVLSHVTPEHLRTFLTPKRTRDDLSSRTPPPVPKIARLVARSPDSSRQAVLELLGRRLGVSGSLE